MLSIIRTRLTLSCLRLNLAGKLDPSTDGTTALFYMLVRRCVIIESTALFYMLVRRCVIIESLQMNLLTPMCADRDMHPNGVDLRCNHLLASWMPFSATSKAA